MTASSVKMIDAWMQGVGQQWLGHEMFRSLRRWDRSVLRE